MSTDTRCGPDGCPIMAFSDLTPTEQREQRARKAKEMSERGFTEQQIAKQFGVDRSTISRDLSEFVHHAQIKKPAKTATNPKGAGRPKGRKGATQRRRLDITPDREQEAAAAILDEGVTLEAATKQFDLGSVQQAKIAVAKEQGRREPKVERSDLSVTAQEKFDAAIRQYKRQLDAEYEKRVQEEFRRAVNEYLPELKQREKQANQILDRHKGIMPRALFRKVLACLESSQRKGVSDRMLDEAFTGFKGLEHVLVSRESPMPAMGIPDNFDWEKAKRDATAARRAKRSGGNALRTR